MKTSLDHLPAEKQFEIREIVEAINHRFSAEMIILFGSFARGDWVEDRYTENGTIYEYKSDYDILVVVDTEVVAIKEEGNTHWQNKLPRETGFETSLNVIFHGIGYLNSEIENCNYFFVDILKEGIMLFNSGKFQLSAPKPLKPADRRYKARFYFKKWFKYAEMFYLDFETNFERAELDEEYFNLAAFMLHQTTECLYDCSILVYTDYKPKTHDLEKLDRKACKLDCRFKTIFPCTTADEIRLFKLLKKAYIEARYKLDYKITGEELEYLSERVRKLRDLTDIACKEKIESF